MRVVTLTSLCSEISAVDFASCTKTPRSSRRLYWFDSTVAPQDKDEMVQPRRSRASSVFIAYADVIRFCRCLTSGPYARSSSLAVLHQGWIAYATGASLGTYATGASLGTLRYRCTDRESYATGVSLLSPLVVLRRWLCRWSYAESSFFRRHGPDVA